MKKIIAGLFPVDHALCVDRDDFFPLISYHFLAVAAFTFSVSAQNQENDRRLGERNHPGLHKGHDQQEINLQLFFS